MMFSGTDAATGKMLWGNILLTACCIFYLLWWILAFRPAGAIKGMKSGWLLAPALLLGIAAVVMIVTGSNLADTAHAFFTNRTAAIAGIIIYVSLFLVTWFAMHRQVTTELLLIVGWAVLVSIEINAMYASGSLTHTSSIVLFVLALITAVVCVICYLLYYSLEGYRGYIDGMIPLILAGAYMIVPIVVCR